MSAIRATAPSFAPRVAALPKVSATRVKVGLTIVSGLVIIQLVQLFIGVLTAQGAYQMANLKSQRHDLTTASDILAAQVYSLSSDQNLANSAQSLGMIPNSNPVFLKLSTATTFGKPKAAYFDANHQVSRNLVPNAAMTTASRWTATTASVVTAQNVSAEVTLNTGELPVSPTH
jgi:hypothetical protein